MNIRKQEVLYEATKTLYHHGYENLRPIGDGGFATIYRVTNRNYQEDFAVKLIDLYSAETSYIPDSFQAEITALKKLYHQNVIKIFNHFTSNTLLYIILELCPGGSFKDVIVKEGYIKQPLLLEACKEIIDALLFCHQRGIAHRDVKPSNILIDKYGRAKLADFGLAQHFQKSQKCQIFGGSLPYLAPEVLQMQSYDPKKADVWALGVTFYEMATGSLPYNAIEPEQLLKLINTSKPPIPTHVVPSFVSVLNLMLEPQPIKRIALEDLVKLASYQKLVSDLSRCLSREHYTLRRTQMKPLGIKVLTVNSATNRRSCMYTKKRNILPIPQQTFDCV